MSPGTVRIRLARRGRKGRPYYRIVVADRRRKRDGSVLLNLGYYDPIGKRLAVDEYAVYLLLSEGAGLSKGFLRLWRRHRGL
jgi:small subunit ribosomal protein S16